jgi:hypothetical protein
MRYIAMDFRTGMYFSAWTVSVLALGMILTARRIRRTSSYLDAFFPLALMNWSHANILLWCWNLQYSASILLAGVTLMLIARTTTPPRLLPALVAGVCVVLLPLCGANGLGLVPALAVWLGYAAILQWRVAAPARRRTAIIVAVLAAAALLLAGLYFVGYSPMPHFSLTHSRRAILTAAAQFLAMGFGPGVVGLSFDHRTPMFFWPFVCVVVVGLFLVTGWMLLMTWWKQPDERARAAGLLLFLGAIGSLALGLGLGRAAFETRYVTLSVPGLCAVYLAWTAYGRLRFQKLVGTLLFATALVVFVPNMSWGLRWAQYLKSNLAPFERDMKEGMAPYQLLHRYASLHQDNELMMDYMPMLRGAGVGAFRYLRDDPPFREIALPLTPVETHDMEWQDGVAHATKMYGYVTFALPRDIHVAGIRLDYTYLNRNRVVPFLGLYWKSSDEADFGEDSHLNYYPIGDRANWRHGTWLREGNETTSLHAWVDRPVQTVRVMAIERLTIKINQLVVLVPTNDAR